MKLYGIIGEAGVGKDEIARMINKLSPHPYQVRKFADKLKEVAGLMLNVPTHAFEDRKFKQSRLGSEWGEMTVREFLQRLGTDAVRNNLHTYAWVNMTFRDFTPDSYWIISDCRMINEAEAIKLHGGVLVRVYRSERDTVSGHVTETEMNRIDPDYVIYNDSSFHDLYLSVQSMVNHFNQM